MTYNVKSGVIGGVVAVVVTSAATALAGTGIGGIFNLGQANSVNAKSTLTGNTNDVQLDVANTSTGASAAGMRITVPAGKPPLTVSNAIKATNLNADAVDGLSAGQLGTRVGYHEDQTSAWFENGRTTLQTASVTAPQNGFVLLSGGATAAYYGGCAFCAVHVRFGVDGTDTSTVGTIVDNANHEQYEPLSYSVTVPATKGTHTYTLIGSWYDINGTGITPFFGDSSLTAAFVPFNGTGSASVPTTRRAGRRAVAGSARSKAMR